MCNLYSFIILVDVLPVILCNITFHNCPSVIVENRVDIDIALVAIANEPVNELLSLNWNDELSPVELGINLKSHKVSPPLPLDFNIVCVCVVLTCLYTNSIVLMVAPSIHQSRFKILFCLPLKI